MQINHISWIEKSLRYMNCEHYMSFLESEPEMWTSSYHSYVMWWREGMPYHHGQVPSCNSINTPNRKDQGSQGWAKLWASFLDQFHLSPRKGWCEWGNWPVKVATIFQAVLLSLRKRSNMKTSCLSLSLVFLACGKHHFNCTVTAFFFGCYIEEVYSLLLYFMNGHNCCASMDFRILGIS